MVTTHLSECRQLKLPLSWKRCGLQAFKPAPMGVCWEREPALLLPLYIVFIFKCTQKGTLCHIDEGYVHKSYKHPGAQSSHTLAKFL